MEDIVVGLLAIAVGAAFCFGGWLMMRIIIPIWGAFAGFVFGAGLVASFWDEGFLSTATGWLVGFAFAILFGALAYLFYEVAVVLAMAAIGFALASHLLVALGVTWSWVIVLAGIALAVVLAVVALAGNMPMVILVVLSAFAGAGTIVTGAMLLFGVVDLDQMTLATTQRLDDDWWWYALYLGLAVAGIVTQVRSLARLTDSLRQSWADSGGRQLRAV
ncbi:MAG TPA: DUF4203 domain-containing protein [Acidimicrobiia bacterium]